MEDLEHQKINNMNAKILGSKGGKKSAEVRRNKKEMKDILQTLLSLPVEGGATSDVDHAKNFILLNSKNMTVSERLMVELVKKAIGGDLNALEMIRDMTGQKPKDEVEITTIQVPKFEGEDELQE